jgi:hypothetical protein
MLQLAMRLERAVEDPAVGQNHGVQGAGNVKIADLLNVVAVVVHGEQLQGDFRIAARRHVGVPVAREDHLAARRRARPEVVNAVAQRRLTLLRRAKIFGPRRRSGVRRKRLLGELHDLSAGDVDLVDVGAGMLGALELGVIHPGRVERNVRVHDGAVLAADQHFFAAVGMQQHQVSAFLHSRRIGKLRPPRPLVVAVARRAHVDDVVIVQDGLVGRDRRRIDVERPRRFLLGLRHSGGCDRKQQETSHPNMPFHGELRKVETRVEYFGKDFQAGKDKL